MATEIITVSVKPGMEEAYRDRVERIRLMEAKFPGYQGLELQPPIPRLQDDWVSLLRFDTAEHLNAWLESDARRDALEEVEPFIDRRERQVTSAFSGWFTFGDAPGHVPPSWKQTMIVLLTLYPIVMLEQMFLNSLLQSLDMAEAIFIGNTLSVAATGFLLIPLALRAFEWWLLPRPNNSWEANEQPGSGCSLACTLYLLSCSHGSPEDCPVERDRLLRERRFRPRTVRDNLEMSQQLGVVPLLRNS